MADETPQAEVETSTPTETTERPRDEVPPEVKAALRKANKEAETLRLKLQEFEDRDKTEAQKLADRAEAAERRLAEVEAQSLRLEVAADKGLTPAQARRLLGSTREELEADADELLASFRQSEPRVPGLDLGPRSTATPTDNSPRGLIAAGLQQTTKSR